MKHKGLVKGTGIISGKEYVGYQVRDDLIYPIAGQGHINDLLFPESELVSNSTTEKREETGYFYCPVVECKGISPWDRYHTFDEAYHRAVLFSIICKMYKSRAGKSKKHADGTMYKGMFIVWVNTPVGSCSYHYDIDPYWDMFNVPEYSSSPVYDECTSDESLTKLLTMPAVDIFMNHFYMNTRKEA